MSDHKPKKMTSAQEYEIKVLQSHINQLYKILGDVNSRLIAISRAKISAEVLATFLVDSEANTKYMESLNKEVEVIIEKDKQEQAGSAPELLN